jgi:hypothetical protein
MRRQQLWWSGLMAAGLLGLVGVTAVAAGGAQFLPVLGVALGGTAGGRLGHAWTLRVSRNALRRRTSRRPASWAWMMGRCGKATRLAPASWPWHAACPARASQPARARLCRRGRR